MKLAEFFVALGFDINGAPELKELDRSLDKLAGNATKLLAIFGGMTAAMGIMLNKAMDSAAGFRRFEAVTGLSANTLRSWEYTARLAGVEGDELVSTLKSLQQARADIAMGVGNVAPWQLLGIAPSEDPFETLKQLRERIRELDPAIARSIVQQMGISEGVFAMLRLSNKEFDELQKKYQLTRGQQKQITEMTMAWTKLTFTLSAVKDRIIAELVPALVPLINGLQRIVNLFANFANWLSKGSPLAKAVRWGLIAVAGAIVAITIALTVLLGVIGLVTAAITALEIAASPILPIIGAISAIILIVTGLIIALVLVVQDLWVALHGGDSILYNNLVVPFKEAGAALNQLIVDLLKYLGIWESIKNGTTHLYMKATGMTTLSDKQLKEMDEINRRFREWQAARLADPGRALSDAALAPKPAAPGSSSVKQENNIDINVNGGRDPYETGRAIADPLKQALSDAAFQIPVPVQ